MNIRFSGGSVLKDFYVIKGFVNYEMYKKAYIDIVKPLQNLVERSGLQSSIYRRNLFTWIMYFLYVDKYIFFTES